MKANEISILYDAVLSSPAMDEKVKLNFAVSRKCLLLVNKLLAIGLDADKAAKDLRLQVLFGESTMEELHTFSSMCLERGDLSSLSEKLTSATASLGN